MHAGIVSAQPDTPVPDDGQLPRTRGRRRGVASLGAGHDRLVWRFLSDMDLVRAVADGAADKTAGEVAPTEAVTIEPTAELPEAARLMGGHRTAHLIVVDGATPVGLLSSFDVANAPAGGIGR